MLAVGILHSMDTISKKIFACQLDTPRKMVHLLELVHGLKEAVFERLGSPHDDPLITNRISLIWQQLVLFNLLVLAKTVIFQRVLNQLDL